MGKVIKKIIDQKIYRSHAKHHEDFKDKNASQENLEKSVARFHELFVQGHISKKEYNKKKNVHPRCLDMKAISPEIKANTCKCSQKPLALKTSGQYGKCWEIFPEEQLKKVAWLTAQIAKRHNIPVVRPVSPATSGCPSANMEGVCWNHQPGIVGHSDIQNQTHGDPGPDFDWKHFLDLVKSNM